MIFSIRKNVAYKCVVLISLLTCLLGIAMSQGLPLSFVSQPRFPQTISAGKQTVETYVLQNNTPVTLPLSFFMPLTGGNLQITSGDTCVNYGRNEINGFGRCTLPLLFTAPNNSGDVNGSLQINYGGRYPLVSDLSFHVQAPPSQLGHLEFEQNNTVAILNIQTNSSGTINLVNMGGGEITHVVVNIPIQFTLFNDNCTGRTLAPKSSCSITYIGARSSSLGTFSITAKGNNADNSPQQLGVSINTPGAVKCWGDNSFGELGDGTTNDDKNIPVDVHTSSSDPNPLNGVVAITEGESHTCALLVTGRVKCWGYNIFGQLGDGTNGFGTDKNTPVDVHTSSGNSAPLNGVAAITEGRFHTCGLLTTGNVKCWGLNIFGQLGNGANSSTNAPVDVHTSSSNSAPLSGVIAMTGGYSHTCALLTTGNVKCWGLNTSGQLGNGANSSINTPVDVHTSSSNSAPLSGVIAITGGNSHACVLLTTGNVKCWGLNTSGQLGNGMNDSTNAPVDVHTSSGNSVPLSGVVAITSGDSHTCALLATGNVKCWGLNTSGQLGNGANSSTNAPVDVHTSNGNSAPLSGVVAIIGGKAHTCALLATGNIKCWGSDVSGELGDGDNTDKNTPVDVSNAGSLVQTIFNHNLGNSSCEIMKP